MYSSVQRKIGYPVENGVYPYVQRIIGYRTHKQLKREGIPLHYIMSTELQNKWTAIYNFLSTNLDNNNDTTKRSTNSSDTNDKKEDCEVNNSNNEVQLFRELIEEKRTNLDKLLRVVGGRDDTTLLIYALKNNKSQSKEEIATLLLDGDTDQDSIYVADSSDESLPIHLAISNGFTTDFVRKLLDVDPNKETLHSKQQGRKYPGYLPIHVALESNAAYETIKLLLDADDSDKNNTIHVENRRRRELPMHIAVRKGANANIIKLLLDADNDDDKSTIHKKDISGCLPIHIALECNATYETIKLLLDADDCDDKNTIYVENLGVFRGQELPIHVAVRNGASASIIKLLLDADHDKSTVHKKDKSGRLPIHVAGGSLRRASNAEVIKLLLDADTDKKTIHEKDKLNSNTPIHNAVQFGATADVIQLLLDADNSANKTTIHGLNRLGRLPVHLAIKNHSSAEVIKLLIDADKGTIHVAEENQDGYLPIHLAVLGKATAEVIKLLLDADDEKKTIHVKKGVVERLPIHMTLPQGATTEVIQLILDADYKKTTIHIKDKEGCLPIHLATGVRAPAEVIKALLDADVGKKTIHVKEKRGCIPVIIGSINGATADVMKLLLDADHKKETIHVKDKDGCLPIHNVLQRVQRYKNNTATDVVKVLLDADHDKETIHIKEEKTRRLPIHIALQNHAADEVIKLLFDKKTIHIKEKNGCLPIHYAVAFDASYEIVNLLFDSDADIRTETHVTSKKGKTISYKKRSLNTKDNFRKLPVHYAKNDTIKKLLLSIGLKIRIVKSNKTFEIRVNPTDKIENVKEMICKEADIPLLYQCLCHNGVELRKDRTISYCNIKNMDTLDITPAKTVAMYSSVIRKIAYPIEDAMYSAVQHSIGYLTQQQFETKGIPLNYVARELRNTWKALYKLLDDEPTVESKEHVMALFAEITEHEPGINHLLRIVGGEDTATLLQHAIKSRAPYSEEIATLLLALDEGKQTLYIGDADGDLPIHYFMSFGSTIEFLKHLIDSDYDKSTIHVKGSNSYLPIHRSLLCNSATIEVIRLLLEADYDKATIHAVDNDGNLPIHYAVAFGATVDVVKLLLDTDADKKTIHIKEKRGGYLPIHFAVRRSATTDVIKVLLEADQNEKTICAQDKQGHIPIDYAKDVKVMKLLVDGGSSIRLNIRITKSIQEIRQESKNKKISLAQRVQAKLPTSFSKTFVVYVNPKDRVDIMKEMIHKQEGMAVKDQCLRHNGLVLKNSHTVSHYEMTHLDTLDMTLTPAKTDGQITIFMNVLLFGYTYEIYADPSETIESIGMIRKIIEDSIPASKHNGFISKFKMLCNNVELVEDSFCLADYHVEDGSTIYLVRNDLVKSKVPRSVENDIGCSIPETELRGITVRQLINIAIEIKKRCEKEGWKNIDGKFLKPEDVNLYDVVKYYVKPLTSERKCSYVEMVANGPQKPRWFVSHWWGESVFRFISSLMQHSYDRALDIDTPYWVCAYAVNQHDIGGDLGNNPKDTPFYKALVLTDGTVSVLDQECYCYTRIWCSYEVFLSVVERKKHLYDAYTVTKAASGDIIVVGLTEGFATSDKYEKNRPLRKKGGQYITTGDYWLTNPDSDGTIDFDYPKNESTWISNQRNRQKLFPLGTVRKALCIRLEAANASMEEDKKRILNSIIGNISNPDANPPESHEKYDEVNAIVRGKFTESGYRQALESGENMEEYRAALLAFPLRQLKMVFSRCKHFAAESNFFFKSLPASLEDIDLNFDNILFQPSPMIVAGLGRLTNLVSMKLNYSSCRLSDDDLSLLVKELRPITKLTELSLAFESNSLSSIDDLVEWIVSNHGLCSLKLNFDQCTKVKSLGKFPGEMIKMEKLTSLDLNVGCCPLGDKNVTVLLKALLNHSSLVDPKLFLHLSCSKNLWTPLTNHVDYPMDPSLGIKMEANGRTVERPSQRQYLSKVVSKEELRRILETLEDVTD